MKDTRSKKGETSRRRGESQPRNLCNFPGCLLTTTERKPYCIDHIDQNDYASVLADQLSLREVEEGRAKTRRGWRSVDVRGTRAREIVEVLQSYGMLTIKRLAIAVDIEPDALNAYLVALERAGQVRVMKVGSRRGQVREIASIVEQPAPVVPTKAPRPSASPTLSQDWIGRENRDLFE